MKKKKGASKTIKVEGHQSSGQDNRIDLKFYMGCFYLHLNFHPLLHA